MNALPRAPVLRAAAAALVLALAACGDDDPEGHDVNLGGKSHMSGYDLPLENCSPCHGASLQGSGDAPSCTSCHEQRW